MGYQNNHLHRRHVDTVLLQSGGRPTSGSPSLPLRVLPGICHKPGEITSNTSLRNRHFGTDGRLNEHPAQTPRREAATDPQGSTPHFDVPDHISTSTFPVHRQVECSLTGNLGGPPVLPGSSGQVARSLIPGESGLQSDSAPWGRSPGGVELVATSPDPLEWENHSPDTSPDTNPVRCLPLRMGGSMQGGEHWRLMDPTGARNAHQLLEREMHINCLNLMAADLGMKSFLKHQHEVAVLLQLDNSTAVAYIKNLGGGGGNLSNAYSLGKDPMALGTGEGHHNHSPTHPRWGQHYGRLQIQGQISLDVGIPSVHENQQYSGATGD